MARKKTIEELRIEREKAEQDLKMRQENLKKLKQKEAELTRHARTHRLCTHGAMLEGKLPFLLVRISVRLLARRPVNGRYAYLFDLQERKYS